MEHHSLVHLLEQRAVEQARDTAFSFLDHRGQRSVELTYLELWRRAAGVCETLRTRADAGDRALLIFPPGLDFLVAYFGCLMAGVIPAPLMPPRRAGARDASAAILGDCRPRFALSLSSQLSGDGADLRARLSPTTGLDWIAADLIAPLDAFDAAAARHTECALLQYTSGSTSSPKGVMVSHANLVVNLEMIRKAFGNDRASSYASWTPLYHDMGLILNALQAVYVGAPCYLMAPVNFVQRPLVWLEVLSRHRIEVAGCPNFGYDHCVDRFRPEAVEGLDLSAWRVAFNGAEPVRAETLERFARTFAPYGFRASSFYPCYGLAEATLLVSGGARGEGAVKRRLDPVAFHERRVASASAGGGTTFVACGRALEGEHIAIVDPQDRERLQAESIGEIWVRGPHVAKGYFGREELSEATFRARIAGEEGEWLRTSDLGFVDADGNLFVVGRIKDLIIIRGANHHPQDIERTVEECHPALSRHGGAAFSVEGDRGEERLVVVQELERAQRRGRDLEEIEDCIREAVAETHDVSPHRIVLIRPGSLPKTTSGKIQRALTRRLFLERRLELAESATPAKGASL